MSAAGRTRWGWHQLSDNYARRFVRDAGIRSGDLVVDVGAGTGAITAALVDAGARVIAVELHRGRARFLADRFAGAPVTVVVTDAADLRLPRRPFRVVANPPFTVTTALLRRLTAPGSRMVRGDLVVPSFVADRWAYGSPQGAGRWRAAFSASVAGRVPSRCFTPQGPPAAVLTIAATAPTAGSSSRRRSS